MIKGFKQFIAEGFVNAIIGKDDATRIKYAGAVYDLLQSTYAKIGGIKGSGFTSKEDMIRSIPFWKLYFSNDKLVLAILYKDRNGRKAVAIATDRSKKAIRLLQSVLKSTFHISFGEYSKGLLIFILKNFSIKFLSPYIIHPKDVARITSDHIIIPTPDYVQSHLDKFDRSVYESYIAWKDYFYVREIGDEMHLKMMIGTPYHNIS